VYQLWKMRRIQDDRRTLHRYSSQRRKLQVTNLQRPCMLLRQRDNRGTCTIIQLPLVSPLSDPLPSISLSVCACFRSSTITWISCTAS
jgi:hypothetical protein